MIGAAYGCAMRCRVLVLVPVVAALAAACVPPPGGGVPKRYLDRVFPQVSTTQNVKYATAPDLVTGAPVDLKLDVFTPAGDTLTNRPAVIWVHGGGFRTGTKAATTTVASEYAQRGYVTFSIDYRLDPGNRCQDVQDGKITDPDQLAAETARCKAAVFAAQHDTQAVVRFVRASASSYGVNPGMVAVGGFSAGAVTALHVAYRSDDPGDVGDFDGVDSRIQAALAASGCNYDQGSIGPGDAPTFLLHAEFDQAVPFACAQSTAQRAHDAGLVAETMFFYGEATHAKALYDKYKAQVDARWTSFLVQQLFGALEVEVPGPTPSPTPAAPVQAAVRFTG
jgi:acetyl esterase/lipase